MKTSKGEPSEGLDFYSLLRENDEFCKELGRAVLASGRLESALKCYINREQLNPKIKKFTLGQLIDFAEKHKMLSGMVCSLEILRDQRNYMTHNIHALFSGLIVETILGRTNLLDSDVHVFTERAWQLTKNLDGLAEILEDCMKDHMIA